ncbi:hypothetical protein PGT21_019331 [Puccinia graminis f. sp. tritici]|uniref:Uncharacterized protein n=1 Tax=Puccinia graminis f. sp. tritici TaxID=56615 RepID=A0A5B0MP14_PUCGR|nr:hypothetical protein PGT21_019331 [Puccinia graminis f. sp. tritici]
MRPDLAQESSDCALGGTHLNNSSQMDFVCLMMESSLTQKAKAVSHFGALEDADPQSQTASNPQPAQTGLMVRRETRRFNPVAPRRSWRRRRPVYIDLDREATPDPRAGPPHVAGRHISEPVVVEHAHEVLMAAGQLPVANPNIQPSESPTNTT